MRPTRLITALLAVLVMLGASLSIGSASAAEGISSKGSSAASATATADRAKPAHRLNAKGYEYGNSGKFFVKGKVTTYRGKVRLQKASRASGPYRTYKIGRTNSRGKFKINFDGKVGTHFRVAVPATKKRRATVKYVGTIVAG